MEVVTPKLENGLGVVPGEASTWSQKETRQGVWGHFSQRERQNGTRERLTTPGVAREALLTLTSPDILSLLVCCCDKTLQLKASWEGKGLSDLCFQVSSQPWGKPGQELEAGTVVEHCLRCGSLLPCDSRLCQIDNALTHSSVWICLSFEIELHFWQRRQIQVEIYHLLHMYLGGFYSSD